MVRAFFAAFVAKHELSRERARAVRELLPCRIRQELWSPGDHGAPAPTLPVLATFGPLTTRAPAMAETLRRLGRIAPSSASVVIEGERGVGKELVARTVHALSSRSRGPFVAENCAAIPASLIESAMLGTEDGIATGVDARPGLFELANAGTVFLDELGTLPLAGQAVLLRILQERRVRRLGARVERAVDVRVLAATNVDVLAAVERGELRADLVDRLSVFHVRVPPLRDRREDVPALVADMLTSRGVQGGFDAALAACAQDLAMEYSWPGNLRELDNAITRGLVNAEGGPIRADHLEIEMPRQTTRAVVPGALFAARPDEGSAEAGPAPSAADRMTHADVSSGASSEAVAAPPTLPGRAGSAMTEEEIVRVLRAALSRRRPGPNIFTVEDKLAIWAMRAMTDAEIATAHGTSRGAVNRIIQRCLRELALRQILVRRHDRL